jgi:membrane associated rhomboid family serine protease
VALLDDLLRLLGTNRTRMQWKLRAWQRSWERRKAAFANRKTALTYEHKTCPSCGHPADADEQTCTRCGAHMGGRLTHRARRAAALLWGEDTPVVTSTLAISLIAIYAITIVWGKQVGVASAPLMPSPLALWRFGSELSIDIQNGQWWRLVTCTFLHVHVLHLIFNVSSLWSVGVYLEDTLGKAKTLALYMLLAVTSSTFSFWWHTRGGGVGNSAGASGAICGLIGVAIGFSARHRNAARHLRGHYMGWAIWILLLAFSGWNIDNAGHIGGLVPGIALGLLVRRPDPTARRANRVWIAAAVAGIALAVASFVMMSQSPLPDDVIEHSQQDR